MDSVTLQRAKGVGVQAAGDGKNTALFFKTASGVTGAVVSDRDLSRLAALLINRSREVAARVVPEEPPKEFTSTPIMASHMGLGRGRSNSEAMVSFRVGNMILTFAVDVSMLHKQCRVLLAETKPGDKPSKAN